MRNEGSKGAPAVRKSFSSNYDELNYLNELICFYLKNKNKSNVATYDEARARFECLINKLDPDDESIAIQDHLYVFNFINNDINKSIYHISKEINSVKNLFQIGGHVKHINNLYLHNKLSILAELLDMAGDASNAAKARSEAFGLLNGNGNGDAASID